MSWKFLKFGDTWLFKKDLRQVYWFHAALCNFAVFPGLIFLVVQGFCLHCHVLPGCTRKIDICLTTRLFKMDAEQNRFLLRSMFPLSRSCHLTARLDFIFSDDSVVASTTHSVIFHFFKAFTASRQTLFPQERKTLFYFERKVAHEHDRHIHAL